MTYAESQQVKSTNQVDDETTSALKRLTRTQSNSELLSIVFLIVAVVALWFVVTEPETPTSLYDSAHMIAIFSGAALVREWTARNKFQRKRNELRQILNESNETKRLVEERINASLMVCGAFAGLDAPETARVLALRAAVRQGRLLPIVNLSTNEEADRWVEQNLELMGKADPQKVEELARPEREELKAEMLTAKVTTKTAE